MSAIWGIINFNKEDCDKNLALKMVNPYFSYKIDKIEEVVQKNVIMGCGHQFFTKESHFEKLPFYDEERDIYFTADCVLDNREELLKKLGMDDSKISDGIIIYQAYLKWNEGLIDYIMGVFAIVIYNAKENKALIFTNHTGNRCIHYYFEDNILYFSTLISPILEVVPKGKIEFNDKWIAACEYTDSPDLILYEGLTAFKGVYQLAPANYAVFKDNCVQNIKYWDLKKNIKKIRLSSQEEYKQLFLKVFKECVRCLLRSDEETGITLSSGLDSSSIGCLAAIELGIRGKNLYSFTSVPLSEFTCNSDGYYIYDESNGVKDICKQYSNIVPEFDDCRGKNSYTEIDRMVPLLELPFKSCLNTVWLDDIYEKARKKNCRIILSGQNGNSTISYGQVLTRISYEIKRLKVVTAYKEMKAFANKNNISKRKVLSVIKRIVKEKYIDNDTEYDNELLMPEFKDKYCIDKKIKNMVRESGGGMMDNRNQHINFISCTEGFAQVSAYMTRFSLMHGVIVRDATQDKRILELCAGLPMECFVNDGVERNMVRSYMKGIVPYSILNNTMRRGLQSADQTMRLKNDWDSIKEGVINKLKNKRLLNYIDKNKIEFIINKLDEDIFNEEEIETRRIINLCCLSKFLDYFGSKLMEEKE